MGEMVGWITLLRVDEMGEFGRVAKKEDGGVIGHDVPVTFICSEFDGETSGIPSTVVGPRFATDSRESHGNRALLALGA